MDIEKKENNLIDLAFNTADDMKKLLIMMKYLTYSKLRNNGRQKTTNTQK
jgi:hypothetical protein